MKMTKRNVFFKRTTTLLLVVIMLLGLFPSSVLAVDTDTSTDTSIASASESTEYPPDYDMNDPDMEMGSLEDGTNFAVSEDGLDILTTGNSYAPPEVIEAEKKLFEQIEQDKLPDYVWDDGSLVVDLNLPNDKTWIVNQNELDEQAASTDDSVTASPLAVGIDADETEFLIGSGYQKGDTTDLSVLMNSVNEMQFMMPMAYSDGRNGAVSVHATGLSLDPEGNEPVTDTTYLFDSDEAQVLYINWEADEMSEAQMARAPMALANDEYTSEMFTVFWDYGYTGAGVASSTVGKSTGYTNLTMSYGSGPSGTVSHVSWQQYYTIVNISYPLRPQRVGWGFLGWFEEGGKWSPLLEYWCLGRIALMEQYFGESGAISEEAGYSIISGSSAGDPEGRPGFSYYWSGSEPYTITPYYGDVTQYETLDKLTSGKTFKAIWMSCPIIWHSMGGKWEKVDGGETNGHDGMKTGKDYDGEGGVTAEHYLSNTTAGGITYTEHDRTFNDPGLENGTDYCQTYINNGFYTSEQEYIAIVISPSRQGYSFAGWYYDPYYSVPLNEYETGIQPRRHYYANWKAEDVTIEYYDTREGTGLIGTQTMKYHDVIDLLDGMNDTVGWGFDGWTMQDGTKVSDANGNLVADFFQGEDPTWCNYYMERLAGGFVSGSDGTGYDGQFYQYYYGATGDTNQDGGYEDTFGNEGHWVVRLYADWYEKTTSYDTSIVWNDFENNDGARPESIHIGLVDSRYNNSVIKEATVTGDEHNERWTYTFTDLPISDNDSSLQKRTYGVVLLGYTDIQGMYREIKAPALDGQEGELTLAAPSYADAEQGTWTTYQYGVNNYGISSVSPSQGEYDTTITFDHALITTGDDITFTMQWDDDGDNDGLRPDTVMLVLYANGTPVSQWTNPNNHNSLTGEMAVSPGMCTVTENGDVWTYVFKDYQRYLDGQFIDYTVAIKNLTDKTTTFNENGYKVTYMNHPTEDSAGIPQGDRDGAIISRAIFRNDVDWKIVWDDENNRDGQRPNHVSLKLMAYQWNENTYKWEYVEVGQAFDVQADAVNTMTASEWTGTYVLDPKLPVYHDGLRILYHIQVTSDLNAFIPEGSFEYSWVESEYGNQNTVEEVAAGKPGATPTVTISQNTNTVSVTANIYWNDSQNNDNIRPEDVILQLYSHAPGEEPVAVPGAAYRVTVSGDATADNWYYTFSGMPKYADGQSGVELIYTVQVFEVDGEPLYGTYFITSNGEEEEVVRYEASYLTEATDNGDNVVGEGSGTAGNEGTVETKDFTESDRAYVKLTHIAETQTMNFSINWHDQDNRDGKRPSSVQVDMYKTVGNGEPIYVRTLNIVEGSNKTWTYNVTGLEGYENGQPVVYTIEVSDDVRAQLATIGYTATTEDHVVHLYYTSETGSISTQLYWSDEDDNDGYRPDSVVAVLYANGVPTDYTVDLNATNDWSYTWNDLPVYFTNETNVGTPVVYSVKITTPDQYTVTYEPEETTIPEGELLYVQLYHGGDVKTVPVTVYWNDNSNYDQRRPETLTVQLVADGEVTNHTLVLSAEDILDGNPNVWASAFEGMPVYSGNGEEIYYSLNVYDPTTTTGGYQVMTAGTTLYLSFKPILSTMYVSFQFDDRNNADGIRPTGLYLQLTANGVPVDDSEYLHTVSFDQAVDGKSWYFGELPVYAGDGTKIKYNVVVKFDEMFGATDYFVTTSQDISLSENTSGNATINQIIVKLGRNADVTTKSGYVYWFDCNNQFGQRPDSLVVTLYNNYSSTTTPYVLNAAMGTVTNRNTGAVVGSVSVEEWTGDSSRWAYTIEGLDESYLEPTTGQSVSIYYWVVANPTNVAEYYTGIRSGEDYGMDVSLTHAHYSEYAAQAAQDYTVNLQWLDNNDAWGYRPDSNGVTVELLANGTVYDTKSLTVADAVAGNSNAWSYHWASIPTYRDGEAIVWTVQVSDVDRYTQYRTVFTSQETTVAFKQSMGFDFTVNWNDSDNDDAVRPENVTLNVFADGTQVGKVNMTGSGNTWTGSISDLSVWRERDADAAIQYTFVWDDETAAYLNDTGYTASATKDGAEVSSDWFYYLSAGAFGDNQDAGYDEMNGTYDWETTLSYAKQVADYHFSVTFDDDVDRDGFRPDSVDVQLLANGKVIDTRTIDVNKTDSVYPITWEDQDVWDGGERIVYTMQLVEVPDEYMAAYNDTNTAVTLTHVPYRVSVTGSVNWDDSTEVKNFLNPAGDVSHTYEQITRFPVYVQLLADGYEVGEPVRIGENAYGEGENLQQTATASWDNLFKYRNNGEEIVYTIEIYSDELTAALNDGHNLTYNFDTQYQPSGTITHDMYDIRGTVYLGYDYNDDFRLADVPVTAYLDKNGELVSQGNTRTDDQGNFEFLNLPQGLYTIRATFVNSEGIEMAGTEGVALDRQDSENVYVIVNRESVNDSDYYQYTATGRAFYQTDSSDAGTIHPVPDGSIALLYRLDDSSTTPEFVEMTTIQDGTYQFTNLSPDNYLVNVLFTYEGGNYTYDATDAANDKLSFVVTGADVDWPDIIKQVNKDVDPVDPEQPEQPEEPVPEEPVPCVVDGYVYYSDNGVHSTDPVSGVDVKLFTENNRIAVGETQTDESGYWSVEGIPAGTYVAMFSLEGYETRVLVFTITPDIYVAGTYRAAEQYFDRVSTAPVGRIEGTVLDENGYPMRAMVGIYDNSGTLVDFAYTDTAGRYGFTVAAGTDKDYNVRIMKVLDKTTTHVVGDPDDEYTSVDKYVIEGNFSIDGVPQVNQLVVIYATDGFDEWYVTGAALTDGNGDFSLPVLQEGNYMVVPYINEQEYAKYYVSVGYEEERPSVTKDINGQYQISGVEDYDSLTLTRYSGKTGERYEAYQTDVPGTSYSINVDDAGLYILEFVKDGAKTVYYLSCPEGLAVQTHYLVDITGQVLNDDGTGKLGAKVSLYDSEGRQIGSTTTILSDGYFGFMSLPEGEYTLEIVEPYSGEVMVDKWTYENDSFGRSYPDGMTNGSTWTWNVNAHMVSGTILDPAGRPVEGATLMFSVPGVHNKNYVVKTDADGHYTIGLASGEYDVTANYQWDATHSYTPVGPTHISVGIADQSDVNYTLERYDLTIQTYRSIDKEIAPNAALTLLFADGTKYAEVETNEEGIATVMVMPDTYVINGQYDGIRANMNTGAVTTDKTVEMYFNSAMYVTGTVTDQDGNPVDDALVYYENASGDTEFVYTDDDGHYEIPLAAGETGEYEIWAEADVYESDHQTVSVDTDKMVDITLDMSGDEDQTSHTLYGVVEDENGNRLANAVVTVTWGNDKTNTRVTSTNSYGEYEFTVPDGTYYLTADYTANAYTYQTNAEKTVHVNGSDTEANLVVLMNYSVVVTVYEASGEYTVPGAEVYYTMSNGGVSGVETTDDQGVVNLYLPKGDYSFYAKTESRTSSVVNVEITGQSNFNLYLDNAGIMYEEPDVHGEQLTIYGYIFNPDGEPIEGGTATLYKQNPDTLEWEQAGQELTDADGYYEFPALDEGVYKVETDYTYSWTQTVNPDNFVIEGDAVDETGNAYTNAEVQLWVNGDLASTVMADETGHYVFENIDQYEGPYTVVVTLANGETLTIAEGEIEATDDTLTGIVTDVAGHVISNAQVTIYNEQGEQVGSMQTDEDGRYSWAIEGDSESYTIEVQYPYEYIVDTSDYDRDTTDRNAPYLTESWFTIEGYVHDNDGNPVEGATVVLTDKTDEIEYDRYVTAADGYYIFDGLEDGIYHVHVIYRDKTEHIYEVDTDGTINDVTPEEPEPPMDETISVSFINYSKGSITEPDKWVAGENTFQLTSEFALRAFKVTADGYEEIYARHVAGDIYEFTASFQDGDQVVIVTVGDANLDGYVQAIDAARVAQAVAGVRELTDIQSLAADATIDGRVQAIDAARIAQFVAGVREFSWSV